MKSNKQHQGGWAVSFAVVGVLLVAALLGGVYIVKKQHDNAQLAQTSSENAAESEKQATDEQSASNEEGNRSDSGDTGEGQPAETTPGQATPSQEGDEASEADGQDGLPTGGVAAGDESGDDVELPRTGPAETAARALAVSLLTFAAAAYIRSRQAA